MLDEKTLIPVSNISGAPVVYSLKELNVRREFAKGETKKITVNELRSLNYLPGGQILIREYLSIRNNEVLEEFGVSVVPEYFWDEADVKNVLLNSSLEELEDCLDFAPSGIIEMVKDLALKLEIPNVEKRDAIAKMTGFNVTKALELIAAETADEEESEGMERLNKKPVEEKTEKAPKQRRVTTAAKAPVEVASKYRRVTS